MNKIEGHGTGISAENELERLFGAPIHTYTRAQAIEDGVLVDVSDSEGGKTLFKFPVAMTRTVWDKYVEVPEPLKGVQDEAGRLWDILWVTLLAAKANPGESMTFPRVIVELPDLADWESNETVSLDFGRTHREVRLKCIVGPGDNGEGVITLMLPRED